MSLLDFRRRGTNWLARMNALAWPLTHVACCFLLLWPYCTASFLMLLILSCIWGQSADFKAFCPVFMTADTGQIPDQIRIGMTTYLKSALSGTVINADELASPKAMLMLSPLRLFNTSSR